MKYLIPLAVFLMLSSCAHVYFTEPQPKGGTRLAEIPSELQGRWMDESGGIEIDATGLTDISFDYDRAGNVIDTLYRKTVLDDTMRLYKAKNLYVFNYRESGDYWELVVIHKEKNGDIKLYETTNPEVYAHDRKLKFEEAEFTIDGEDRIVNTLTPEHKDSLEFKHVVFSGQMRVKTLRNILKEEYLMAVLKSDGTVYLHQDSND